MKDSFLPTLRWQSNTTLLKNTVNKIHSLYPGFTIQNRPIESRTKALIQLLQIIPCLTKTHPRKTHFLDLNHKTINTSTFHGCTKRTFHSLPLPIVLYKTQFSNYNYLTSIFLVGNPNRTSQFLWKMPSNWTHRQTKYICKNHIKF